MEVDCLLMNGDGSGGVRRVHLIMHASGERCLFLNARSAAIAGQITFLWLGRR